MASLKKLFSKKEEMKSTKKDVLPEVPLCDCGQPVATELGQTSVCVYHIRTS